MLKKFASIFLSKFPDRFAYLTIIICIIVLGSFAYETVGMPIQTANAMAGDSAAGTALGWIYGQKCFGDRIQPDTVHVDTVAAGNGAYDVTVDFVSLEYKIDMGTGALHHIPVNHTVAVLVSQGKVTAAAEGLRDLLHGQVSGPVKDVSREYL